LLSSSFYSLKSLSFIGLSKNLVSRSDQDMHLKAQGIKFSERTADSLEIPPFSKGCVKTAKVMMDLMKVRYGNDHCDVW
jgi:hypothetical protein